MSIQSYTEWIDLTLFTEMHSYIVGVVCYFWGHARGRREVLERLEDNMTDSERVALSMALNRVKPVPVVYKPIPIPKYTSAKLVAITAGPIALLLGINCIREYRRRD